MRLRSPRSCPAPGPSPIASSVALQVYFTGVAVMLVMVMVPPSAPVEPWQRCGLEIPPLPSAVTRGTLSGIIWGARLDEVAWGDAWGGDSRLDREADGESPRTEVPEPVRLEPVAEGFGFASWATEAVGEGISGPGEPGVHDNQLSSESGVDYY